MSDQVSWAVACPYELHRFQYRILLHIKSDLKGVVVHVLVLLYLWSFVYVAWPCHLYAD
jgi:hypothetical protein